MALRLAGEYQVDTGEQTTFDDDDILTLGTDKDIAQVLSSAAVSADEELTDVIVGTSEHPGVAANSYILSNITTDGDLLFLVNKGGHSQGVFWADGDTGDTAIMAATGASVDHYIAGTKVLDHASGAFAFQEATTISSTGTLTLGTVTFGGAVSGGSQAMTGMGAINGLVITADTGVITTGTWNGGAIGAAYGGTGIANNAASTVTISGAYALTLTLTAATGVTLPTTGTLATLGGTEELDNKTLDSSVAKGAWTASGVWTPPAMTLGGTVTANGQMVSGDIRFGDDIQVDDIVWVGGTNTNANMTQGITLRQGASDNEILALKSSDVDHDFTDVTETDTYALFKKQEGGAGGLRIDALTDQNLSVNITTFLLQAFQEVNADTTKSTAGRAILECTLSQHDGANSSVDVVAGGNVFGIRARRDAANTTVLLVTQAGALWLDGGITTGGAMFMKEQATADGDVAAFGQFWVKDDAPNIPMFTDDAGVDHQFLLGAVRTKHEFHMPFDDPTGQVGNWEVIEINAAQGTHFVFQVPENYESMVNATVVMIPDATETIQWDINVSVAAAGEAQDNDTRQALNETLAVTADQVTEADISGQLADLAGGDYVAIDFLSDIANLRILGFEFDYL